jgi:hypothetical protein
MMDRFSEHGYAYLVEVMSNLSKHTLLITKDRPAARRTLTGEVISWLCASSSWRDDVLQ